jgi:6-phosphofructokinase
VGVPKTIDNDILLMDKTFGFDTAVEAAQRAINSAYIEVILSATSGAIMDKSDSKTMKYMHILAAA